MASMVMSALTTVDPKLMDTTPLTAPSVIPETVPLSWLRAEIFMCDSFRWGLRYVGGRLGMAAVSQHPTVS